MCPYGVALGAVLAYSISLSAAGPEMAYVYRGELYSLRVGKTTEAGAFICPLFREALSKKDFEKPPNERIQLMASPFGIRVGLPVRWRISHGVFWMLDEGVASGNGLFRVAVSDLDLFDENDAKKEEKWDTRIRKRMRPEEVNNVFHWYLGPSGPRGLELEEQLFQDEIRKGKVLGQIDLGKLADRIRGEIAFVDFLPTSPISGREFLLENGKCKVSSMVAEYSRGDAKIIGGWRETYSKEPVAVIDLGFTEPFTVFSHKGSYFFLTRSCKLYSATKDADGKWKVEKLWSEANRPIHAVITDTATNKSYAFTQAKADKDGKKARDVYFEFDAKLAPVEFDRTKIKPFQLDPPMNTLREYTQVLIDARKIDPTPPKKSE